MDVRPYADLFLSGSREHLTAFNQLLLEWERDPAAREPSGRGVGVDVVATAARSLGGSLEVKSEEAAARPSPSGSPPAPSSRAGA